MKKQEILMISSYPPRKCGIATYSQDLIRAIENKYNGGLSIKICALQKKETTLKYNNQVKFVLKTWVRKDYIRLAESINKDYNIGIIYLQHEFGLYDGELGSYILDFLKNVEAPVITTFHTILSDPSDFRKKLVQQITAYSSKLIVMTNQSLEILKSDYKISADKVKVIPHGTHLIKPRKKVSKKNNPFPDKTILSTFGLISAGKSIETALDALPTIVEKFPDVLYLVIGKTHPEVLANEGEQYRNFLQQKVKELQIEQHVLFVNKYLTLGVLIDYLKRTDIYLFTSKDPQQAVSGTLAYAMAAGCPVISTPIPHSLELLDGAGINFDFQDPKQLANAAILMLSSPKMMEDMHLNALHKISPTAWQNAAIEHIHLAISILEKDGFNPSYQYPSISMNHIKRMTTHFGMLQFAKIAEPDKSSGYTVDDNARALIAISKDFELTGNFENLRLINIYLEYILFCQQTDGSFLNYVTIDEKFFEKNKDENLEDANGRAIWALGEFLSFKHLLHPNLQERVETALEKAIPGIEKLQSPRAIAFCIKGLYYYFHFKSDPGLLKIITRLADNLISKYRGVSNDNWKWFESYLTYGNAVLPEALLLAGQCTNSELFKSTAKETFDYLLSITHSEKQISVISNIGRHNEGEEKVRYGEQPIEFAYTILALGTFFEAFGDAKYLDYIKRTFNWFLGDNHLHQIIYNPCTGGCYDGLEEHHVNLNQGAESSVSYLLARLTMENYTQ